MMNDFKSLIHKKSAYFAGFKSKHVQNADESVGSMPDCGVEHCHGLGSFDPSRTHCRCMLTTIFYIQGRKKMHRPTAKATISIRFQKKLWWFLNFYLSSLILLSLLAVLLFYFFMIWSLFEVWIFHVLCVLKSTPAILWHNPEINHPYILENLRCTRNYQNVTRLSYVMPHQTASLSCSIMIFNFDKALCE